EIFVESIKVADANSLDLTLNQKISVIGEEGANKGYIRMISTSGAHDTYVKGVHLGSRNAASIGDVEVQGMQTYFSPAAGVYMPGAVITISGH
ncbi:MAG: pilus assembly protein FilA, partial [Acinetobacter sp.]|nr:pilus assembly protein FilA [Acinetobacter sp.]